MPKFRFIGNGKHDPQEITAYGVRFELNGEPQEGPERLRGNPHFEEVSGEKAGPVMKHRGRGKYDVFLDGELIADNVTKDEAEALIDGNAD